MRTSRRWLAIFGRTLVRNAVESCDGTHSTEIVIETGLGADRAVIVGVADEGLGLPEDGYAKLFEPFFTTKDKGMGMGLAISRSIVETHGGKLWAVDNQDRGATFMFSLPTLTAHDKQ